MQTVGPVKSLAEFAARRRRKGLIHFGWRPVRQSKYLSDRKYGISAV